MFELIALYEEVSQDKIGGPFTSHFTEEIIGLFHEHTLAELYIEKSKLKNPIRQTFASTRVFRKNSLLSRAVSARVVKTSATVDTPIDPVL